MLNPVIVARIEKEQCVICGKDHPDGVARDMHYGKVKVCERHKAPADGAVISGRKIL